MMFDDIDDEGFLVRLFAILAFALFIAGMIVLPEVCTYKLTDTETGRTLRCRLGQGCDGVLSGTKIQENHLPGRLKKK